MGCASSKKDVQEPVAVRALKHVPDVATDHNDVTLVEQKQLVAVEFSKASAAEHAKQDIAAELGHEIAARAVAASLSAAATASAADNSEAIMAIAADVTATMLSNALKMFREAHEETAAIALQAHLRGAIDRQKVDHLRATCPSASRPEHVPEVELPPSPLLRPTGEDTPTSSPMASPVIRATSTSPEATAIDDSPAMDADNNEWLESHMNLIRSTSSLQPRSASSKKRSKSGSAKKSRSARASKDVGADSPARNDHAAVH